MQNNNQNRRKKIAIIVALLMGLSMAYSPLAQIWNAAAAGTVSGRVFQDFNGNGNYDTAGDTSAVDAGVQSVTVTLYDSSGAAQGNASTLADGTFSIASTGTGPYRVEFTNLTAGFQPSARNTNSVVGGSATNSGSTIQFVADGATANVNLAVNRPADYCQNNPDLCTSVFVGTVGGSGANDATVISFPYGSGTTSTTDSTGVDLPSTHNLAVPHSNVGTTWGLAYHRGAQKLFASAFTKRHSGFRNDLKNSGNSTDPTGEIFIMNRTGTTGSLFVNLNTLFGSNNTAGANPHEIVSGVADYFNDTSAFDAVGKTAIGDLELSEDEQTLYVVNLNDRKLYALPIGAGTPVAPTASSQVTVYNLAALMNPGTVAASGGCPLDATTPAGSMNRNLRPGGLRVKNGKVYVGLTCTAQSTGAATDLRAYVYALTTGATPSATQVVNFPLNYPRGCVSRSGTTCASALWLGWISNQSSLLDGPYGQKYYPQPWLTDIEFDGNYMILALADRTGQQTGNDNGGANTGPVEGVAGGDTLRLRPSGATWTLENNGSDGVNTGAAGNAQGPGNGEFYYEEGYVLSGGTHDEVTIGGVTVIPGFRDAVISAFDPSPTGSVSGQATYRAGGMIYLRNSPETVGATTYAAGSRSRSYQIFGIDTPNTFGKSAGIGGVKAMCDRAPIEIGNLVWRDTNGNGVQDAQETRAVGASYVSMAGITVRLYDASNAVIATATTDQDGEYYFSSAAGTSTANAIYNLNLQLNTTYQVRFDNPTNYASGGVLNGLLLTTRNQTTQAGFDDGSDSDASLIINPSGSPAGTFPVISVTTGAAGENNHNFDVGFASSANFSIGNRVWFDTNNDGQINAVEVGVSNVAVKIYNAADTTFAAPLATQTTDASGYYRFDNRAAGNYVVRVEPSNFANAAALGGRQNTSGSNSADLDSTASLNGEDGVNPTGAANTIQTNGILSATYTLGAPGEPTNETDVQSSGQGAVDAAANMTVDYGFYRLNLSGTVWRDNGAGANNNNGILDLGENGISQVRVQLFNSSGVEILVGADGILGTSDDAANGMLTNGSGNYNFQGLPAGQYRVVVTPPVGNSSTPTSTTPDNNIDNDDNGFPDNTGSFAGKIIGGLVTLTPGSVGAASNNTVTNATGTTSNPTVDFGFVLGPTAVRLEKLDAYTDGKSVELKWSTGEESGNLGFNIYRESNGERKLLNAAPIAGNALRTTAELAASGGEYSWTDKEFSSDAVYYLEDIDVNGSQNTNGAITPQFKSSLDIQPNAKLISDLASVKNSSGEREIVGTSANDEPTSRETTGVLTSDRKSAAFAARQKQIAAQGGAKISVNHDGWYSVSADELRAANFDVNSNRNRWQLYANGAEVPFKLNADDSIEFFGRGLDTPLTDRQVYYLVNGQTNGLRLNQTNGGAAGEEADARSYPVTVERKDRAIYSSAILNGDADNWFGAVVIGTSQTVQDLTVRNLDASGQTHLQIKLQGATSVGHTVNLRFNETELGAVSLNGFENQSFDFDLPSSAVREGVNQIRLQSAGGASDVNLVDSIRLNYWRGYTASANQLRFTVPANQTVRVGGFDDAKISVYEIAGGASQRQVVGSEETVDGTFGFSLSAANYDREFLAVGNSIIERAATVERNAPSSWNSSTNKADFVIITSNDLRGQAENLAAMREAQGLKTRVALVDDLFDEYSFGEYNPQAVKDFLRTATTAWQTKPRYVLLFGDASYDARNRLGLNVTRDVVLTKSVDTEFMETSSDAWLADFDGDGAEDVALGRLPVANQTEAQAAIEKLVRYDNQAVRAEKSDVLIADRTFENYSADLQSTLPNYATAFRIDRSNLTDAETHGQIIERLNDNPLLVTYTGHGSTSVWASSNIFRLSDAANLANNELSFYLLMTCLNGYTHSATNDSLAEALIKSERGAIAVWSSSGTTHSEKQFAVSQAFTKLVFNAAGKSFRIGDVVKTAKRFTDDADVRRTWQLVGDPTIMVK